MERNIVFDDLSNEEVNIKELKGIDIIASKIENIRRFGNTVEVFCKGGRWATYKMVGDSYVLKIDTRWK